MTDDKPMRGVNLDRALQQAFGDTCPRCGATVADPDKHREWHDNLQGWRRDVEKLLLILGDRTAPDLEGQ
jgi:hypothetical protein